MSNSKTPTLITAQTIDEAYDYAGYRQMIDDLLAEGKTTGTKQSEDLTNYTKMNVQRMSRWDKTALLSEDLKQALAQVKQEVIWLILTEGWCGDAAQNIPILVKMAEAQPKITPLFILRDENPDIMNAYLTNGGQAIPKLVCLNADTLEEIFTWGPRPADAQAMVMAYKANPTEDFASFAQKIHKWYADNKNQQIQEEFLPLISQIS